MKTTKYVLALTDSYGERVLVSAQGDITPIDEIKFMDSEKNAKNAIKKIVNLKKKQIGDRGVIKIWRDKAISEPESFKPGTLPTVEGVIKRYEDALLMINGGLEVVPVEININI